MSSSTTSGMQLVDRGERALAVLRLADHRKPVRLEQRARAAAEARVVVDDDDRRGRVSMARIVADAGRAHGVANRTPPVASRIPLSRNPAARPRLRRGQIPEGARFAVATDSRRPAGIRFCGFLLGARSAAHCEARSVSTRTRCCVILARMASTEQRVGERILAERRRYVSGGVSTPRLVVAAADGARVTDADGRVFLDFAGGIGCQNTGHRFAPGRRGDPPAGRRLPPPVLHGRRLRAVRRDVPPARRALAVRGRRAEVDPRQLGRGGERERRQDRARRDRPPCRRRLRQRVPRPDAPDDDDDEQGAPVQGRASARSRPRSTGRRRRTRTAASRATTRSPGCEGSSSPRSTRQTVACVLLEPVQGEGGFVPMPPDYPARLAEVCREHGILYVDDEVQSGVGRTGKMWAIEHYDGVEPDLLVSGKSIGGGLPLAAVTGRAELMDAVPAGGLGGTFGGNPLSCAAAVAVLEAVREPEFLARATAVGDVAPRTARRRSRARHDEIGEVRGLGPMLALRARRADARPCEGDRRRRLRARPPAPRLRPLRERHPAPARADDLRRGARRRARAARGRARPPPRERHAGHPAPRPRRSATAT